MAWAAQDEARHIALGRALLRAMPLWLLHLEERVAIYRWLRSLWREAVRAVMSDHGAVFALAMPAGALDARWVRHRVALERLGLITADDAAAFDDSAAASSPAGTP